MDPWLFQCDLRCCPLSFATIHRMDLRGLDILIKVVEESGKEMLILRLNDRTDRGLRLEDVPTLKQTFGFGDMSEYRASLSPVVAASLRDKIAAALDANATVGFETFHDRDRVIQECHRNVASVATWDEPSKRAVIYGPRTAENQTMMRKLKGSPRSDGSWSIAVTTIRDFLTWNEGLPEWSRFEVTEDLRRMASEPLPEPYDGTAESLRKIPVDVLKTVQANNQSYAMRKKNPASIKEKLESIGVRNCYDLLMLRPARYIDRSEPQDVRDLIKGEKATIVGTIVEWRKPSPKLDVMVMEDSRGMRISASYFNARWMPDKFRVGDEVIAVGKYSPWEPPGGGRSYPQLEQPLVDPVDKAGVLPIMPEYKTPGKAALSSVVIMHCEQELINRLGDGFKGPAWADAALRGNDITLESYGDALKTMHLPDSKTGMDEATAALAFCEMVQLLVCIESARTGSESVAGVENHPTGELTSAYVEAFPWPLTGAQERAVESIRRALESPHEMRALLVGDVGAGKTTVMHLAALMSVESGHQAVVCAPTEILAQQLYDEFVKLWGEFPEDLKGRVVPVLHAGYKGKGSAKRRRETVAAVADGTVNLIFGTHSVLNLDYQDLGFVGVDEQHKFGAEQRSRLLEVREDGRQPDMLMQTATPIPRSMAQVYYGDVEYLRLDEMPAGRQPIVTEWVKEKGESVVEDPGKGARVWDDCLDEIRKGHGVFVVCPMVEDSEKMNAASVKKTAEVLKSTFFKDVRVETVFGGQAADKQDAAILGFKNGDVDVLVASSVVEVGVSCAKATRMVILDASHFGLASLHQIRGRIGRSSLPSKCWLVAMTFNDTATRRMQAMCDTMDGWTLSKTDLRNRGTGSVFGSRQSGKSDLMFADLVNDAKWIEPARKTALALLEGPSGEEALSDARRYFGLEEGQLTLA